MTTSLLLSAHSLSQLPWWAFLPTTAVTLRLFVTTPLTLVARRRTALILRLQPVITARAHALSARLHRDSRDPRQWERDVRKGARAVRKEIWARWGVNPFMVALPLVQVPVWVLVSFTLRNLLGIDPRPTWLGGGRVGAGAATEGLEGEGGRGAEGLMEAVVDVPSVGLETGGFGSMLDLMAAEPLLSAIFSGAVFINLEMQRTITPPTTRQQKIITRMLQVLAVAAFPLTAGYPAALTLYWASSALFSLGQNIILHLSDPLPPVIKQCKQKKSILETETETTSAGSG